MAQSPIWPLRFWNPFFLTRQFDAKWATMLMSDLRGSCSSSDASPNAKLKYRSHFRLLVAALKQISPRHCRKYYISQSRTTLLWVPANITHNIEHTNATIWKSVIRRVPCHINLTACGRGAFIWEIYEFTVCILCVQFKRKLIHNRNSGIELISSSKDFSRSLANALDFQHGQKYYTLITK